MKKAKEAADWGVISGPQRGGLLIGYYETLQRLRPTAIVALPF